MSDNSTTRACSTDTDATVPHRIELNETTGRWLGERGIFRHFQPTNEEALDIARQVGKPIQDTMSTVLSGVFDGDVTGELVRVTDPDDGISYVARVNGVPETWGCDDLYFSNVGELCDVAKVLDGLRYEWGAMCVYKDWLVSRTEIYRFGPRVGGAS